MIRLSDELTVVPGATFTVQPEVIMFSPIAMEEKTRDVNRIKAKHTVY